MPTPNSLTVGHGATSVHGIVNSSTRTQLPTNCSNPAISSCRTSDFPSGLAKPSTSSAKRIADPLCQAGSVLCAAVSKYIKMTYRCIPTAALVYLCVGRLVRVCLSRGLCLRLRLRQASYMSLRMFVSVCLRLICKARYLHTVFTEDSLLPVAVVKFELVCAVSVFVRRDTCTN